MKRVTITNSGPNLKLSSNAEMPSPCDILYVITDLNLGGVPLHLHRLARVMRERGFAVQVVTLAPPGTVAEMLRADGFQVHSCDAKGGFDLRVFGRLGDVFRQVQPRLIHSLLFHANVAGRWAARRVGIPADRILCEIQTVEVERRWHLWIDAFTYNGCRLTIGNSPSVIDYLATHARIPQDRLHLIRGGVDVASIRAAKPISHGDLGFDGPMILWVGRLDPVKGLDHLVNAFAAIARNTPAHLYLAGDGLLREHLENKISQLRLTDRIHLLGPRTDVPSLLKSADVFVLPSRTEGLPNALLEAMAAGCPIVTTDVPGCRDLIQNERQGLVVAHGHSNALAAAILRLLQDRGLAAALSAQAMRSAAQDWPIERMFVGYAELYRSVLAQSDQHLR